MRGSSPAEVLGNRALNRALLARQLLLERAEMPVAAAIEHLVGLQAQEPLPPYVALWSRLAAFDPHELGRMLSEREVVRLSMMRWTIHLFTARDALRVRPLLQPMIERRVPRRLRLEPEEAVRLAAAIHELLAERPLRARELAGELVACGFGADVDGLTMVVTAFVPLVQVPPRGVWGAGGRALYATLDEWLGRELDPDPSLDDFVLRYLRAFGPASVMDMQNWSGLTRLRPVFERLRSRLVTFHDERGRELFDLPDAPRPDPEVTAPVRFLGEYDNILLGHADRTRIIPSDFPWDAMLAPGRFVSNVLVDGMLRATWWIERDGKRSATLAIRPFRKLSRAEHDEVGAEAERLIAVVAADAQARDVRFEAAV